VARATPVHIDKMIKHSNKVWGIGLGRTGTKSLNKAFQILNYNTMHNPNQIIDIDPMIDGAIEGAVLSDYKYLDLRFPNSKFILTTREIFSWLKSCKKAIKNLYPIDRFKESDEFYNAMIRNRSSRFGGLDYNEEQLITKYYQHHFDVVSHFKGRDDKLLIIDIMNGDGWEKLCPFLNIDIPNSSFPSIQL